MGVLALVEENHATKTQDYWQHDGYVVFRKYTILDHGVRKSFNAKYAKPTIGSTIDETLEEGEAMSIKAFIDHCHRIGNEICTAVRWSCPLGYMRLNMLKFIPLPDSITWIFFKMVSCNNLYTGPDCCRNGGGENVY